MNDAETERMPRLTGAGDTTVALYSAAMDNLVRRNTVASPHGARFIRAGGGYPDPWTRDAAINSWNAASEVTPDVARDTLLTVCTGEPGQRVIAQDDQWWDQVIWIVAAWHHYLVTGDRAFLREAEGIARRSLEILHSAHFDHEFGLYAGAAVMQDGISGYPSPPADPDNPSSFVLDHPRARAVMTLSTNALYVGALRALAAINTELGQDGAEFERRAAALSDAIRARFRVPSADRYGFLIHGSGPERGRLEDHQEGCGLAFLALFVADPAEAATVLSSARRMPFGLPNLWPHIAPYSDAQPARHGGILWPMVMGMFGAAAASAGAAAVFERSLGELEELFRLSGAELFEVYNGISGRPDGGWQSGIQWDSQPDQTWSATAYLRQIHEGVFGLRYRPDGLALSPLGIGFGGARLDGLRYRDASLTLTIAGDGARLAALVVNGERKDAGWHLSPDARGHYDIQLDMRSDDLDV